MAPEASAPTSITVTSISTPTAAPTPNASTTTTFSTSATLAATTTAPATTIPATTSTTTLDYRFTISDVDAARLAHSYTADCPVRPEDLVMVTMDYWGFDSGVQRGQIVVARSQGDKVAEIFRRLFAIRYPIESVTPIGDLPTDIEDDDPDYNNTSGLHCRFIGGTTTWSEHAKGLAIDINPFLNPYITSGEIWPANSGKYRDRSLGEPGMITAGDAVVDAFADSGWYWGGYWRSVKDYHHFSTSGR
jgi:hypothetical protein